MATQQRNQELVSNLTPDFVRHDNIQYQYGDLISRFKALPGLVGLWYPGNIFMGTGNICDSSGQNRILTYNGNPTINYLPNGVAYADLDGVGDYWSRADEPGLDITGTEAWATNKGLTIYSWVWFNVLGNPGVSNRPILSKFMNGGQYSYALYLTDTGANLTFIITSNGTNSTTVNCSGAAINNWYFCSGVYVPSTSMTAGLNAATTTNTTNIPASIFAGTEPLEIGRVFGSQYINGRISIIAIYANSHTPSIRNTVFQQTRSLYGVN